MGEKVQAGTGTVKGGVKIGSGMGRKAWNQGAYLAVIVWRLAYAASWLGVGR